jgi:Holliday junction resolvase RusA-like endonuclease
VRPVVTSDNPHLKSYRNELALAALAAMMDGNRRRDPIQRIVPLVLDVTFYFARPPSLKKSATEKTARPDLDKLVRAVGDAITGIVCEDDSQIVQVSAAKEFGLPERTEVKVRMKENRG